MVGLAEVSTVMGVWKVSVRHRGYSEADRRWLVKQSFLFPFLILNLARKIHPPMATGRPSPSRLTHGLKLVVKMLLLNGFYYNHLVAPLQLNMSIIYLCSTHKYKYSLLQS